MASIKVGRDQDICPVHGIELLHLESAHSMRYRFECDFCGAAHYSGCPECALTYFMKCSSCHRDFCIDCGSLVSLGRHAGSTALCFNCADAHEPWNGEEDDEEDRFGDEFEDDCEEGFEGGFDDDFDLEED